MFIGNEGYTHLCFDCGTKFFEEQKYKYKDEKTALILTCCALDVFFSEGTYETCKEKGEVTVGQYIKLLNGPQYKIKSFYPYLVELLKGNAALTAENVLRDERETRWTAADKKNKAYVMQAVGYDCFDDESYTSENRKFLFNTLADYLTDEVMEDPHKMQSVVSLCKSMLQQEQIDRAINAELRKVVPDYGATKQLNDIKNTMTMGIAKVANENGISAKSSGKSGKSSTALTSIMKEMGENGFEEIKVNIVDVKLSESYQEIAAQNARALIAELGFTTDEYARMLGEQSNLVREQQDIIIKLQEELRLSKIAIKSAEQKGGKK